MFPATRGRKVVGFRCLISTILFAACAVGQDMTVIRNTSSGKVKGYVVNAAAGQVERYFGIPYAAPPVGALRWRAPMPHSGWANTVMEPLDAVEHGSHCPQTPTSGDSTVSGNEDCLFLDIYAPHTYTTNKFPVMVFTYGGGFWFGFSEFYDGTILSGVGDVIVVIFNYRLGSLGFLSTGDSQAPGNYGMLDQIAALEWVQENIEHFGGDKDKVTIFGQSAGAVSVLMQTISPLNSVRGTLKEDSPQLFHRVIAQSGSPFAMWGYMSEPSYYSRRLVAEAGCPTFSTALGIECLRRLSFTEIVQVQHGMMDEWVETDPPWLPVADGKFLTDTPANMVASTELREQIRGKYDFMMGINDFDTTADLGGMTDLLNEEEFTDYIEIFMDKYFNNSKKITEAAKYKYLDWFAYPPSSDRWKYMASDMTRDVLQLVPALNFSNLASDRDGFNSSVFFYYFTQQPSNAFFKAGLAYPRFLPTFAWRTGSMHAEELGFVFGLPFVLNDTTDAEKQLSFELMTYWTNFAKTGDPNNGNSVSTAWPRYDSVNQEYIIFGSKEPNGNLTTTGDHLNSDKVAFWTKELPLLDVGDGMDDSINIPEQPVFEPPDAIVKTDKGLVQGLHIYSGSNMMDRFVRIPFADPPVGVLRFKLPEQHQSWNGVLMCDGDLSTEVMLASSCATIQNDGSKVVGQEDCLYLNLWIPGGVNATRSRLLPVVVWIHGGTYANATTMGLSYFYDMEQLVAQGDIIGVGINYRTGPLGFFSTGDENAPGNMGYLDQVAALQWVKTNIVSFGGDADQVTILGQGFGAASVSYHMLSPISEDLFRRGIAESGVTPAPQTLQRDPLRWAKTLATNVGCPTESSRLLVGCLRDKPVEDILNGISWDPLEHGGRVYNPWGGVIDRYFIVSDPTSSIGDSRDKDFLLGHNSMDGHVFASVDFPGINGPNLMSRSDELASTRFAPNVPSYISDWVAFKYIDWEEAESDDMWPKLSIVNLHTDSMFAAPTYWTANERVTRNGTGSTHVYKFSAIPRISALHEPEWMEADFESELPYVFGQPFMNPNFTDDDRSLSLAMMTYWSNFAWTGDPNSPNSADTPITWPEFEADKKYALNLDTDSATDQSNNAIISNYRGEFVQFWSESTVELWSLPLDSCPDPESAPKSSRVLKSKFPRIKNSYQNRAVECPDLPLVRATEHGCVEGYVAEANGKMVERYLGIQYAASPGGSSRFLPPAPPSPWSDVRAAKNFSKMCPQNSVFDDTVMSEDCLYLCVYVPRQIPTEEAVNTNLTVMLWLHGGAYMFGDGMGVSKGETLASLGNVIVVTINYRLGSFGFMTTDDSAAPGNYGLLDQHFAIKWTKDNIRSFGGDPEMITIFGESAGAQSVQFQTLSPTNDALGIKRAVMESPTIVAHGDLKQLEAAKRLAETAGCDVASGNEDMVGCLRNLDASDLLRAQSRSGLSFLPTVDGTLLTDHPRNMINETRVRQWTYLMGVNSGEGSVRWGDVQKVTDEESFHQLVLSFESAYGWRTSLIDQQYADYDDLEFFGNETKMQLRLTQMFGDERYVTPTLQQADDYSKIGSDVYFYYFTYPHQRPDFYGFPSWAGAAHSADVSFVFGDVINDDEESEDVKDLSRAIITYWSNFAKTGDPNTGDNSSPSLVEWPRFSSERYDYGSYIQLDLGYETFADENLRPTEKAFWNDFMVAESGYCEVDSTPVSTTEPPSAGTDSPEIQTEKGPVQGMRVKNDIFDVDVFLGIPYAQPPIGDLRFARTVEKEAWTEPLNATFPKPPCLQFLDGYVVGDEDCLYLDVFKPHGITTSNDTIMPVFIWIHGDADGYNPSRLGGSFWSGGGSPGWNGSSHVIDPTYLTNFGNVIVVRPNFRLGSLGFLTTETDVMAGNYGLRDLVEALSWTFRNAMHFGGDPNKITLVGQGSGGAVAELLAILPSTRKYVKRVISQSGSVYAPWVFCQHGNCKQTKSMLATSTGCQGTNGVDTLACLRQLDAATLVNAIPFLPIGPNGGADGTEYNAWGMWRIRRDGDIVPDTDLDELFASSAFDLVTGTASHEFYSYIEVAYAYSLTNVSNERASTTTILNSAILDTYRFLYGTDVKAWPEATYSTLAHAYTNWQSPNDPSLGTESAVSYYTDMMFAAQSYKGIQANTITPHGTPYQYVLSRPLLTSPSNTQPAWAGARHGDDIIYMFGIPFTSFSSFSDDDRDFSNVIMSYWINFAWNGDPNNALAADTWMEYTYAGKHYLNMDSSDVPVSFPTTDYNAEKNNLWQDVIPLSTPEYMTTTTDYKAHTTTPLLCVSTAPPIGQGLGLRMTPAEADTAIYVMFSFCLILGAAILLLMGFWLWQRRSTTSSTRKTNTERLNSYDSDKEGGICSKELTVF